MLSWAGVLALTRRALVYTNAWWHVQTSGDMQGRQRGTLVGVCRMLCSKALSGGDVSRQERACQPEGTRASAVALIRGRGGRQVLAVHQRPGRGRRAHGPGHAVHRQQPDGQRHAHEHRRQPHQRAAAGRVQERARALDCSLATLVTLCLARSPWRGDCLSISAELQAVQSMFGRRKPVAALLTTVNQGSARESCIALSASQLQVAFL